MNNLLKCRSQQMMASLPAARVTPSRPFPHVAVDYTDPLFCKTGLRKTSVAVNAYVSVFVCLASKAIHLELVSGLSTDAFMATICFSSRLAWIHLLRLWK